MPVLINFKICDNAKECNGIAVCPTGALSWDEKNKTIKIDNNKCTSCGACENACMVEAIRVAKNQGEYKQLEKEIKEDKRKISDLFVDRYGAQPIHPAFFINEDKFQKEVIESDKITVAELFNDNSIMCLRLSIVIKDLFKGRNIKYRKVKINTNKILNEFKIKKLPSLLFFDKEKLIGKIEGYYDTNKFDELNKKIKEIIKI